MPESQINSQLSQFESGASRLMTKGNLDKYGPAQKSFLDTNELVRVDVPDPTSLNLRIPSGNEAGANDLWLPGGKLPDGNLELVVFTDQVLNGNSRRGTPKEAFALRSI